MHATIFIYMFFLFSRILIYFFSGGGGVSVDTTDTTLPPPLSPKRLSGKSPFISQDILELVKTVRIPPLPDVPYGGEIFSRLVVPIVIPFNICLDPHIAKGIGSQVPHAVRPK